MKTLKFKKGASLEKHELVKLIADQVPIDDLIESIKLNEIYYDMVCTKDFQIKIEVK